MLRIVLHPKYRPRFAKRAGNHSENVRLSPRHSPLLQQYRRCELVPVGPGEPLVHAPRFVTLRTDMPGMADSRSPLARSSISQSGEPSAEKHFCRILIKNKTRLKSIRRVLPGSNYRIVTFRIRGNRGTPCPLSLTRCRRRGRTTRNASAAPYQETGSTAEPVVSYSCKRSLQTG